MVMEDLEGIARRSVLGESVTVGTRIDFAGALLARNVPNARDGVAVLTLTKGGATTAVVKVLKGVNAFIVTTNQAGNRASREALGARGNVTRAVLTLLGGEAFVSVTVVVVIATLAIALVIVITVSGFTRRRRWVGRVGRGRGRVAAKRVVGPVPAVAALRGRGIAGWLLVRGTTAESVVPRPVVGTVLAGRWAGRITWSSIGKTAVFTTPPELPTPTTSSASENEGKGQGQEKDARNERHFET